MTLIFLNLKNPRTFLLGSCFLSLISCSNQNCFKIYLKGKKCIKPLIETDRIKIQTTRIYFLVSSSTKKLGRNYELCTFSYQVCGLKKSHQKYLLLFKMYTLIAESFDLRQIQLVDWISLRYDDSAQANGSMSKC